MKTKTIAWMIGIPALLLLVLLTSVTKSPGRQTAVMEDQQEINLALREIADALLKEERDFLSPIPPIRRDGPGNYLITLGNHVDYYHLRTLVDGILHRHNIRPDYRLSLLNCENGALELGFLALASDEDKAVPCQEREQTGECYNLRIALVQAEETIGRLPLSTPQRAVPWVILGLAIGSPIIWLFWGRKAASSIESEKENDLNGGWLFKNEQTAFHPANQLLQINGQAQDLTFREAKLLHFFFDHANQVLERDRILEAVWGDEGVIVGRSLDVFVSRLRKKLKTDPNIQIVNVHGVGYKLTT